MEHVDLQDTLFEALRKYDAAAYNPLKLYPKYWVNGAHPKILDFMDSTSHAIKAMHATKKCQRELAAAAATTTANPPSSDAPQDVAQDEGKGKSKVRRVPCPHPLLTS